MKDNQDIAGSEQKIRDICWRLRCSDFKPVAGTALAVKVDKEVKEAVQALLALVAQERLDAIARVRQETELRGGGMTHPHDIA